jgi:diaminopimelate decarboxylase
MNDLIVKQALLPELEIGDLLCFENTGAYAMTEGMALFLTRDLPWVYLRDINGDITLLRKRQETEIFNTPIYERK